MRELIYRLHVLTLFFTCSLVFFACKTDSKVEQAQNDDTTEIQSEKSSENMEENAEIVNLQDTPDEQKIIEELTKPVEEVPVNKAAKVENITDVELVEKSEDEKKKEADLKKRIAEEKVNASENKGESCELILKKYEKIANDFLASSDIKLLVQMNEQNNDVFFAACRKDEQFQQAINKINDKVDAALEE